MALLQTLLFIITPCLDAILWINLFFNNSINYQGLKYSLIFVGAHSAMYGLNIEKFPVTLII